MLLTRTLPHSSPKLRLCCCLFCSCQLFFSASASQLGSVVLAQAGLFSFVCSDLLQVFSGLPCSSSSWVSVTVLCTFQPNFLIEYPSEVTLQVQSYISYWFCSVICKFLDGLPVSPVLGLLPGEFLSILFSPWDDPCFLFHCILHSFLLRAGKNAVTLESDSLECSCLTYFVISARTVFPVYNLWKLFSSVSEVSQQSGSNRKRNVSVIHFCKDALQP